jgi:thiosulfate reductase cytochrome b subunit
MTNHASVGQRVHADLRPVPGIPSRLQYLLMVGSLLVLAVTGLPQRFDSLGLSAWLMDTVGGIETLRTIHHGAGAVLLAVSLTYLLSAISGAPAKGRNGPLSMIPDGRDYVDAAATTLYLLGRRPGRPSTRNPSYFQKFDYWVLAWGLTIMMFTGLVRLFPARMTDLLSGDVVAAALQAHGEFALLIVAWIVAIRIVYAALSTSGVAGAAGSEG